MAKFSYFYSAVTILCGMVAGFLNLLTFQVLMPPCSCVPHSECHVGLEAVGPRGSVELGFLRLPSASRLACREDGGGGCTMVALRRGWLVVCRWRMFFSTVFFYPHFRYGSPFRSTLEIA
jgi:hypothetical protein